MIFIGPRLTDLDLFMASSAHVMTSSLEIICGREKCLSSEFYSSGLPFNYAPFPSLQVHVRRLYNWLFLLFLSKRYFQSLHFFFWSYCNWLFLCCKMFFSIKRRGCAICYITPIYIYCISFFIICCWKLCVWDHNKIAR